MSTKPLVIVKVGKTSKIKLNNVKAYRAVTFGEAKRLLDKNPHAAAFVIESISIYEKQDALNMVEYLKEKDKPAFIHCVDGGTSHESEVASMLGVSVTSTLDELQSEIARRLAIMVYTSWGRKVSGIEDLEETVQIPVQTVPEIRKDKSSDLFEAITAIKDSKEEEITEQALNNKDDLYEILGIVKDDEEDRNKAENEIEAYRERSFVELNKLLEKIIEEKQSTQEQLGQAYDKIQKLLDIKDSVELDRDRYKDMVDTLESEKKALEVKNPVDGAQLDEAKRKIVALQQANIELEQKVIEYNGEKAVANKKVTMLEQELSETKESLGVMTMQIEAKDSTISKLNASLSEGEAVKLELVNAKAEKAALEKTAGNLREKIKELTLKVDSAMSSSSADDLEKIRALREEVNTLSDEVDQANSKIAIENRGRLIIGMLLSEAVRKKDVSEEALLKKNEEVAELTALTKNLKSSLSSSSEELQLLQQKYDKLEEDKNKEIEKIGIETETATEEYQREINSLKTDIDTKNVENRRLRAQLVDVQKRLDKSETELTRMMLKSGASENEFETILEAKRALEASNEKLESTVKILKSELMTVTSKVSLVEDANTKLEASNKKLRESQLAMKAQMKAGVQEQFIAPTRQNKPVQSGPTRIRLDCHYNGKGQIIPVFGSGSNGVTTMVVSLARRMPAGSKVLVMDLDLTNAKLDGWFKMSPNIKELQDIVDPLKRTALSALFERGVRYVIDNKTLIMRTVNSWRKGLTVDYFSGSLVTPDARKIMSISFSDFMTYLGNTYDYIVVDLGKIGASDITNEFIRMFTDIAPISVIMSLNDGVESRNLNVKMSETVGDRSKLLWVINKAHTTKLNAYAAKIADTMGKTVIFPYDPNMTESGKNTFDLNDVTKGRFVDVLETVLSKKQGG